ncbi:MAG: hypothetical protein LC722_04950 [Actinobacteria bacterium]|nr:hypothetical protein [Actinomycetota bacterium]
MATILATAILCILGSIGTFAGAFEDAGVWLFVAATIVMFAGILFKGI